MAVCLLIRLLAPVSSNGQVKRGKLNLATFCWATSFIRFVLRYVVFIKMINLKQEPIGYHY